jgi:hypothetical protein
MDIKKYMRCDNINVQSNEYIHQLAVVEEDDNIHLNTLRTGIFFSIFITNH